MDPQKRSNSATTVGGDLYIQTDGCMGKLRGIARSAAAKYNYGEDLRDPEPPPFHRHLLNKIFFPKDLTEQEPPCVESMSLVGLASQTDLKDGIIKVTKGVYTSVRSVQDAKRRRKLLLDSIPTLTTRELNKLTLPASEHLLIELEEDGFIYSKHLLEKFMNLDDQIIEIYEEREQKKLKRKSLRENRYYLIVLCEALKLVEAYRQFGRKTEIYSLFMYLGEFFKGLHSSWLWMAYEMYKLAIETIDGYRVDLGYGEALARYVLGKFCFYEMDDPEKAMQHFEVAHKLSYNRTWNMEPLGGAKEEEIHAQSTYLDHLAAMALSQKIILTDPKRATELGFRALKRVTETGKHPDIEEALRSLAYLYQKSKQPEISLTVLRKQIKQSEEQKDYRGMALGYYIKAHCYKIMKKYDNACQSLQTMINLAEKHNEMDLEALGCKSLGEYYFSSGKLEKADELLTMAVKKYMEVGMTAEAAKVSIHAGAAKAAKNMSTYAKVIVLAKTQDQAKKLLNWQMTEDPKQWERLAAIVHERISRLSRESIYQTTVEATKLNMPDHVRIRNSLLNSAEIEIVETSSSDSD